MAEALSSLRYALPWALSSKFYLLKKNAYLYKCFSHTEKTLLLQHPPAYCAFTRLLVRFQLTKKFDVGRLGDFARQGSRVMG